MCSFEQFLRTGYLRSIKLYLPLEQIENTFGKAKEKLQVQDNIFILKYDYVQLTFQDNIIRKIHIRIPNPEYNKDKSNYLDKVLDEPWILTTQMSLKEFIDLLYTYEAIPYWEIDSQSSIGTSLCLIVEKKVKVYFDLEFFEFSDIRVEGDIYYSKPI